MDHGFHAAESLRRPPCSEFHCGETRSENHVTFRCCVPGRDLFFSCRSPSCGVLTGDEHASSNEKRGETSCTTQHEQDEDDSFAWIAVESYPFAVAQKTGFQIWPGTRLLVESLRFPRKGDHLRLQHWQQALVRGDTKGYSIRVLELGAGVGVVGTSLADAGAQVLLTDLPSVVADSLTPNLLRNANKNPSDHESCPPWLRQHSQQAVRIGRGWAAAASLDWTKLKQLSEPFCSVDLIVAADCAFLSSMLQAMLQTVSALFEAASNVRDRRFPRLLLSCQQRDPDFFTSIAKTLAEIRTRSWAVECLSWYPVTGIDILDNNECQTTGGNFESEVFLFEVTPATIHPP
jgi:Lysine methyltransferase